MTEPTLKDLREIAESCMRSYPTSRIVRDVAKAFLALTDPTPLTAEHCREAGLELDRICKAAFVDDNANESLMVWTDLSEMATKRPTLGILRLALLRENSDDQP